MSEVSKSDVKQVLRHAVAEGMVTREQAERVLGAFNFGDNVSLQDRFICTVWVPLTVEGYADSTEDYREQVKNGLRLDMIDLREIRLMTEGWMDSVDVDTNADPRIEDIDEGEE